MSVHHGLAPHYCLSPDYPGGKITCVCSRGVDHTEDEFDIPLEDE